LSYEKLAFVNDKRKTFCSYLCAKNYFMPVRSSDPYSALRFPEFRNYSIAGFLLTAALLIQESVLGYKLYEMTKNPLTLGFIGLAEAIPYISLALFGGHFADRRDKKVILRISLLVILGCSLALIALTRPAMMNTLPRQTLLLAVYGIIGVIGLARGFFGPAYSSLKAFLVPREFYINASSWYSSFWQAGAIAGPALSGILLKYLQLTNTLWAVVGLLTLVLVLLDNISSQPLPANQETTDLWTSIRQGIRYVFVNKIILFSISLDLFSVLFGGVIALLPVFAQDILKVDELGFGLLKAAPAAGALLTIFLLVYFPPTTHAWRNLLVAVAGFGVATLVFAVSTNFLLSLLALFFTGAFDSVSVVIRQAILQVIPPDEMRGRVNSVNGIFVSSSNELGAFESGVAARFLGTVPSVVFGGCMTLVIVGLVWLRSKDLFEVKLVSA
jgi:MFS family permease